MSDKTYSGVRHLTGTRRGMGEQPGVEWSSEWPFAMSCMPSRFQRASGPSCDLMISLSLLASRNACKLFWCCQCSPALLYPRPLSAADTSKLHCIDTSIQPHATGVFIKPAVACQRWSCLGNRFMVTATKLQGDVVGCCLRNADYLGDVWTKQQAHASGLVLY